MNKLIIFCISMLLTAGMVFGQDAKDSIFGDVEEMLNNAKAQQADILSPEYYARAVESYNKANEYYVNNESTRDIREKLTEAQRYCQRALEVVKLGVITLKEALSAREDAMKVEANLYSEALYKEAEEKFDAAARQIEDDDLDDARDRGAEAEEFYRKAELQAIKVKLLGDGRKMISEAQERDVEEYAPQTFRRAQGLLAEVEKLLTYNRYAGQEAAEKAYECVYEAQHALFLAQQIRTLKENELNWEKLILEYEGILAGFADKFDEKVRFDDGMKDAITVINTRIENLQNDYEQLVASNAELQEKFDELNEQATSSSLELAQKKEREEKLSKVKSLFTANEAKVILEGDNLVIRLHGLNFPSGKSIIEPEYFSLLTKIQEALRIFPDKHILLEGHTDSRGNAATNKRLSEERAIAVREYLIANMGKSREQITAIGYGAAKPVASNQTAEGRELNRRIDVVINMSD